MTTTPCTFAGSGTFTDGQRKCEIGHCSYCLCGVVTNPLRQQIAPLLFLGLLGQKLEPTLSCFDAAILKLTAYSCSALIRL